MFGQWASLGGFGMPAGGAGPSRGQMGWSAPSQQAGGVGGMFGGSPQGGGMGVYSPELMAMLRQRLAGMGYGGQQRMPMGGGYNMVSPPNVYPSAPAMPTNPGAFTPYQPPVQAPVPGPEARHPTPVAPRPAPMPAPTPPAMSGGEPLGRRLLSRGYWASRGG